MGRQELDKLVKIGKLKVEPGARAEFDGLFGSAKKKLADSRNESLAPESRFDLAYNASHAFALAALRQSGYRSNNRYVVFQALVHTLDGLDPTVSRVLAKCHNERNLAEYEGRTEVDEKLLDAMIESTAKLEKAVSALDPPPAAN